MGYTGKQVIHPAQVPVVQRAFSPSQEQVQWASGLIQAFHQHQQSGKVVCVCVHVCVCVCAFFIVMFDPPVIHGIKI